MQRIYTSEDALYQILYDKAHRPSVYLQKTQRAQAPTSDAESKFRMDKVAPENITFVETRFLEHVNTSHTGLIQKYPMFLFMGIAYLIQRRF